MKLQYFVRHMQAVCRSRKGAWIEIQNVAARFENQSVAPVRERGLKCAIAKQDTQMNKSRSRKGAWIEIASCTQRIAQSLVAPVRERGLKSNVWSAREGCVMSLP